jgi:hypothetical protein
MIFTLWRLVPDFWKLTIVFLGLILLASSWVVWYEANYPCLEKKTEIVQGYQKVGDTLIPFPVEQTRCVRRAGQ